MQATFTMSRAEATRLRAKEVDLDMILGEENGDEAPDREPDNEIENGIEPDKEIENSIEPRKEIENGIEDPFAEVLDKDQDERKNYYR